MGKGAPPLSLDAAKPRRASLSPLASLGPLAFGFAGGGGAGRIAHPHCTANSAEQLPLTQMPLKSKPQFSPCLHSVGPSSFFTVM